MKNPSSLTTNGPTPPASDASARGAGPPASESPVARGSDAARVSALLARWADMRGRVVGRLRQRGFSPEDADDIFGQALVRAAESAHRLRDLESAEAWFFRLAQRVGTDLGRRQTRELGRRGSVEVESIACDDTPDPGEPCACSVQMLDALRPEWAELLRDVDMNGERVADAARRRGITANSASVRLFRARRALRERLLTTCGTTSAAECMDCGCGPETSHCHGDAG